jgi:hypothetical protein
VKLFFRKNSVSFSLRGVPCPGAQESNRRSYRGAAGVKNLKKELPKGDSPRIFLEQVIAGWSSLVARQAHNLKVVGSNPTPATNLSVGQNSLAVGFFVSKPSVFGVPLSKKCASLLKVGLFFKSVPFFQGSDFSPETKN